jgi:hypothetical protein
MWLCSASPPHMHGAAGLPGATVRPHNREARANFDMFQLQDGPAKRACDESMHAAMVQVRSADGSANVRADRARTIWVLMRTKARYAREQHFRCTIPHPFPPPNYFRRTAFRVSAAQPLPWHVSVHFLTSPSSPYYSAFASNASEDFLRTLWFNSVHPRRSSAHSFVSSFNSATKRDNFPIHDGVPTVLLLLLVLFRRSTTSLIISYSHPHLFYDTSTHPCAFPLAPLSLYSIPPPPPLG